MQLRFELGQQELPVQKTDHAFPLLPSAHILGAPSSESNDPEYLQSVLLDTGSVIPMLGASGAISGVLGGYLLLFPKRNVRAIIFNFSEHYT